MGWVTVINICSASAGSIEIARYFTDAEGNRGVQRGSPIDGNWGIPGVMFTTSCYTRADLTLFNGINFVRTPAADKSRLRQAFANGDSLSVQHQLHSVLIPAERAY